MWTRRALVLGARAAVQQSAARSIASVSVLRLPVKQVCFRGAQRMLSRKAKAEEEEAPLSLPEALALELQEELGNDEVDQEYQDARQKMLKLFKLKEEVGSSVVTLTRNAGGETIEVKFNVQDEDEDFAQDFEEEDEESEEDASNTGLNFEVTISKGELGSMHARCLASGSGELLVRTVQHLPAGKSASDTDLYEGPRFDQLSDALQDGIVNYLEDKLIDAELCFFILAHSAQKEQKEYENWLNKLLVFTDSK